MGNCLKTQLKEAVQNESLLKIGEVVVHLNTGGCVIVYDNGSIGNTITDLNDNTVTQQIGNQISCTTTEYPGKDFSLSVYKITDKYNIGAFYGLADFDINDFKYWSSLVVIDAINMKGSFDTFYGTTNMTNISIRGLDVIGNIMAVSGNVKVTKLDINSTQISGALEDLLDAIVSGGRDYSVYNQLEVNIQSTNCTYNGVVPESILNFTFDASGWHEVV